MTNEEMVADLKEFMVVNIGLQIASQINDAKAGLRGEMRGLETRLTKKIDTTKQELVEGMADMAQTIIYHVDELDQKITGLDGRVTKLEHAAN
jgi:hypothetical protein